MSSKGNYYSLRSQHEKAALYFQRALKLNPRCLGAWTLMGHEYMEMKNTSAAIQAYRSAWKWNQRLFLEEFLLSSQLFFSFPYFRHAIEVNKRDYRAWYGLGQTYEILRMPFYCLYYYRKAHQLRYVEKKKFLYKNSSASRLLRMYAVFIDPMTRVCWSLWVKAMKSCHNKRKQRR